jgi:signal transduction histidine kinase
MTVTSFIRSRRWALLLLLLLLIQAVVQDSAGALVGALAVTCVFACIPQWIARLVVPFLALVNGAADFLNARVYVDSYRFSGLRPTVVPWHDNLLMPGAAALGLAGAWLYFRLDAPGAARLAAAAGRLRERAGVSFWPASAVVAVLVIGCELLSGLGKPSPVPALTVVLLLATLAVGLLMPLNPRAAVGIAVLTLPLMAVDGIQIARHWPGTSGDAGLFGVLQLDNEYTAMAVGIQGGLLILASVWCGWKLLQDVKVPREVELKQRVEVLARTRADAVDSAAAELRRIERDLHDGAQARLVALGMNLRVAERLFRTDPDAALSLVSEARDASSRALTDLRALVRGIYPPVLADRGLVDAIRALALELPLPAVVEAGLPGKPELPVASAAYFSVAEALTNVTKHAGADGVRIQLSYERGILRAQVTDDGVGGADPSQGTGLRGVERRLAAFDGILAISSPAGGPTIVVIEVPCALS